VSVPAQLQDMLWEVTPQGVYGLALTPMGEFTRTATRNVIGTIGDSELHGSVTHC
jgi:hypothetical protein